MATKSYTAVPNIRGSSAVRNVAHDTVLAATVLGVSENLCTPAVYLAFTLLAVNAIKS